MKILLKMVFMFLLAGAVFAEEEGGAQPEEEAISGQELLDGCAEGAAPGAPNQYCMRYIFGLIQVVDMLQQSDPTQRIFCIDPRMVTLQEVTEKTVNWLKKTPERLNEDAYKLVTEALHANYSCDTQNI